MKNLPPLSSKDFQIDNTGDMPLLAAIIAQQFEQINEMKRQLIEFHLELCKREAEVSENFIVNTNKACELLGVKRDAFKKIISNKDFELKYRVNAKNGYYFNIDDLLAYKNYVFSKDFQYDSYFFNPEYFAQKGKATEEDLKRLGIEPKKHNFNK